MKPSRSAGCGVCLFWRGCDRYRSISRSVSGGRGRSRATAVSRGRVRRPRGAYSSRPPARGGTGSAARTRSAPAASSSASCPAPRSSATTVAPAAAPPRPLRRPPPVSPNSADGARPRSRALRSRRRRRRRGPGRGGAGGGGGAGRGRTLLVEVHLCRLVPEARGPGPPPVRHAPPPPPGGAASRGLPPRPQSARSARSVEAWGAMRGWRCGGGGAVVNLIVLLQFVCSGSAVKRKNCAATSHPPNPPSPTLRSPTRTLLLGRLLLLGIHALRDRVGVGPREGGGGPGPVHGRHEVLEEDD